MAELEKVEDLDSEQPSTLKESFQRWLIMAGVLITLLFVYLFIALSSEEDEALVGYHDAVPQQVQDGEVNEKNAAIERFQREIVDDQFVAGEKMKTPVINESYLPRKKEVKAIPDGMVSELQAKRLAVSDEQSSYQKYLEKEEMRALQSLSAQDSLGDDSAFYGEEASVEPSAAPKSEAFDDRQAKIQKKIDVINKYREGVAQGTINPGSLPLTLNEAVEP